jgi:hypothetical protein
VTKSDADDQATQLYYVADKSRRLLLLVAIASVIVLLLIVAYSLNQARNAEIGDRAPIDPSLVHLHSSAADMTQGAQSSSTATEGSSDIAGYVNFLQGIEQRRTVLRQSFGDAVSGLISSAAAQSPAGPGGQPAANPSSQSPVGVTSAASPPAAGAQVNMIAYQQAWLDLVRDFNSQQTPKGCEILSNNYYRVLQDYVTLLDQLNTGPHTQDAISIEQSQSQSKIETDALAADQSLQQLCASSGVAKSFGIAPDLTAAP